MGAVAGDGGRALVALRPRTWPSVPDPRLVGGNGITEVAVNLFTMYTLNFYISGGGEREMRAEHPSLRPVDHSALASARWPSADVFGKLELYRQLIHEFGWEPMRQVFRSYYDRAYPRTTYGSELDGFAIRFSAVVERDLASFFRHWVYPLSHRGRGHHPRIRLPGVVAARVVGRSRAQPHSRLEHSPAVPRTTSLFQL